MDSIEDQAFANLSSLRRIYLNHNNLTKWDQSWFFHSNSLEIIDLQFNNIKIIPQKAFSSFKKLKELHFGNNALEIIEPDIFENLDHLEFVSLSNNKLKEIQGNIFPQNLKIDYLEFNGNFFNFISDEIIKKLYIKKINIHYNPWNCLCLEKIYQWIRFNNGTLEKNKNCYYESIPECAVSKIYTQKCGEHTDEELTQRYLDSLKTITPIFESCVKFSKDESNFSNFG